MLPPVSCVNRCVLDWISAVDHHIVAHIDRDMACAGLYSGAIVATFFTIFVLVTVEKLEQKLFIDGANRILVIKYADASPDFEQLKKTINDSGIKVNNVTYSIDYTKNEAVITFKVTIKTNTPQKLLLDNLHNDSKITGINMIS